MGPVGPNRQPHPSSTGGALHDFTLSLQGSVLRTGHLLRHPQRLRPVPAFVAQQWLCPVTFGPVRPNLRLRLFFSVEKAREDLDVNILFIDWSVAVKPL